MVVKLMESAKSNRYGHRDPTTVLVGYRHGLRAADIVDLPSIPQPQPFVGSNAASRQPIQFLATSFGRYGG
jgi:hypothetical protein